MQALLSACAEVTAKEEENIWVPVIAHNTILRRNLFGEPSVQTKSKCPLPLFSQ